MARGPPQGKIASKISEISKILRVVCDKNRKNTKNDENLLEFTVILMILPKISRVALKIFSFLLIPCYTVILCDWLNNLELLWIEQTIVEYSKTDLAPLQLLTPCTKSEMLSAL